MSEGLRFLLRPMAAVVVPGYAIGTFLIGRVAAAAVLRDRRSP